MTDIGVHWVVKPTFQIPLFEQNSGISAQQVLKRWGQPLVGLAKPCCSWAVQLKQSLGQMVRQPCLSRCQTRLPKKLAPVELMLFLKGMLVGVELLLVEIELGREIVNYTSKNNVS